MGDSKSSNTNSNKNINSGNNKGRTENSSVRELVEKRSVNTPKITSSTPSTPPPPTK